MNIVTLFEKRSRPTLLTLGGLATLSIGIGDYFATNHLLEFSVFFLLPISFLTWFISRKAGFTICVISGAIILGVNLSSPMFFANIKIAYWNAVVWLAFFLLITLIIADLKMLHLRERELARTDALTGARTRRAFYEFAEDEVNRAHRLKQPLTLAYLDIDGFKDINDRNGHATGDRLLITVARSVQASIRRTDMLARMGGDEFALLLPNTTRESAGKLLGKVLSVLMAAMKQKGWPATFSIGAVTFLRVPESLDEMVQRADEMMYSVKQAGKNGLRQDEIAASSIFSGTDS